VPIHERTYRRIEGEKSFRGRIPWIAVSDYALVAIRRGWLFKAARFATFLPAVGATFGLYVAAQGAAQTVPPPPEEARLAIEGVAFAYFGVQLSFSTFFAALAGGPVIAEDLRRHALELYFSKPLSGFHYLLGKWFAVFRELSFATVLPTAASAAALIGFGFGGFAAYGGLAALALLAATLASAICALVALGVSAVGRSARYAVVLWFVVSLFTHLGSIVLKTTIGDERFAVVSFRDDLLYLSAWIMDVRPRFGRAPGETPGPEWCAAALAAWCGGAAFLLSRRVRREGRS
jgi:hypothetical protein